MFDVNHYKSLIGKRIKVVALPGFERCADLAKNRGGILTDISYVRESNCTLHWTTDGGLRDFIVVGVGWADVVLDEPSEPVPVTEPTLTERLAGARAEVQRLETMIAEQIARKAEDAKYPLPKGYRWDGAGCIVDPSGGCTAIVAAGDYEHLSGPVQPPEVMMLQFEYPDDPCIMYGERLDVVRALIARYDASQTAKPYSIDIDTWACLVDHDFQEGDVVDLTFESGCVVRRTIEEVDSEGDIWVESYMCDDPTDLSSSELVGRPGGRGVRKVTLVSRGAE